MAILSGIVACKHTASKENKDETPQRNQNRLKELFLNKNTLKKGSQIENYLLAHEQNNQYEKVAAAAKILFTKAVAADDLYQAATAAKFAAKAYLNLAHLDSAYLYLNKAQGFLLDGYGTNRDLIESYIETAVILNRADDQAKAESMIFRALKNLEDTPLEIDLYCAAYQVLSEVNIALGNLSKAARYQKNSFNLLKNKPNSECSFRNLYWLGNIFYLQENYPQALIYLQAAEKILPFINEQKQDLAALYNLLSVTYSKSRRPENALYYHELARKLLPQVDSNQQVVILLEGVKQQPMFAAQLLDQAWRVAKKSKQKQDRLLVYDAFARHNAANVAKYAGAYVDLFDSIDNEKLIMQNKVARITFRNDELLRQKDAAESSRKHFIVFVLTLLLLVVGVVAVIIERVKSHEANLVAKKKQLQENTMQLIASQEQSVEQERLQQKVNLAKQIQANILGQLATIKDSLNQRPKFEADGEFAEIKQIQQVEQQVRQIAHSLNDAIFSENKSFTDLIQEQASSILENSCLFFLEVETEVKWDQLSLDFKIDVYCILGNLVQLIKTTKAKNCFLTVSISEDLLKLIFLDDGLGEDFALPKYRHAMRDIQDRVENNRGEINLKPRPGKGNTIIVTLPLRKISAENANPS